MGKKLKALSVLGLAVLLPGVALTSYVYADAKYDINSKLQERLNIANPTKQNLQKSNEQLLADKLLLQEQLKNASSVKLPGIENVFNKYLISVMEVADCVSASGADLKFQTSCYRIEKVSDTKCKIFDHVLTYDFSTYAQNLPFKYYIDKTVPATFKEANISVAANGVVNIASIDKTCDINFCDGVLVEICDGVLIDSLTLDMVMPSMFIESNTEIIAPPNA
ncbi:MAG: hypothetical protein RSB59_00290 [Clostridia bacterium]